jgi:hypothetical protein
MTFPVSFDRLKNAKYNCSFVLSSFGPRSIRESHTFDLRDRILSLVGQRSGGTTWRIGLVK